MYAPDNRDVLEKDESFWTTKQVAKRWNKSPKYVSTAAKQRRIPGAIKMGDEWRFDPAEIRAMRELSPPESPRPRRSRKQKPLTNPARPGRRGRPPAPPASPSAPRTPQTASEWADFFARKGTS